MNFRKILSIALVYAVILTATLPTWAGNPIAGIGGFTNKTDGTVVFAADWNSSIGGIYTWIANNLLAQLNVVQNKGDIYVHNGTGLQALPVGANSTVLTALNTTATGLQWAGIAAVPLTTKGDIPGFSSALIRVPIGANGQVAVADSTQTAGWNWETVSTLNAPSGTVVLFNTAVAGIPTGWVICDGNNGTQNLIGMMVVGAGNGSSSANPSGFGNLTNGTLYGATAHTHTTSISGNTSSVTAGNVGCTAGTVQAGNLSHFHTFAATGTSSGATNLPACIGLVYIQKQ